MVPRVFLLRPVFASPSEVLEMIRQRGGDIALSTVSKALKRMEEDLIVKREGREVSLLQPDTLLDKLREAYVPPQVDDIGAKLKGPWKEFVRRQSADATWPLRMALSGASSADRWAVMGRADVPVLYCDSLPRFVAAWMSEGEEDSRFPDVNVRETVDPVAFFDVRREEGLPYASPVQTYLELAAGDKRDRETADEIRAKILAPLAEVARAVHHEGAPAEAAGDDRPRADS
jgi:hypothetical protein